MKDFSPIVLFVYNRPWHTQQTLEALSRNELADQSVLYVFADGPKENADIETISKINETRKIVKSKNWCKEVNLFEKEKNKGLAESIIAGVTEIVNRFGKIIVLEDDMVTGKGFLIYMNEALTLYSSEDKVISIHAYNYPIKTLGLPDTFFLKGADCWGWATWLRGWSLFEKNAEDLYRQILEEKLNYEFDFYGGYPYTEMLKNQIEKKVDSWAIRWYASAFLKNKYTLYPKVSLLLNIGLDGSGTHNVRSNNLSKHFTNYCRVEKMVIERSIIAMKRINRFHSLKIKSYLKTLCSKFRFS